MINEYYAVLQLMGYARSKEKDIVDNLMAYSTATAFNHINKNINKKVKTYVKYTKGYFRVYYSNKKKKWYLSLDGKYYSLFEYLRTFKESENEA